MIRTPSLVVVSLLLFAAGDAVQAQDVPGVELCTHEARMDRRTGCLQSNVEYLQRLIVKNATEAQRKLDGAASEIGALKAEIGALKNEMAVLKTAITAQQASIEKLQAASRRGSPPDKPPAK